MFRTCGKRGREEEIIKKENERKKRENFHCGWNPFLSFSPLFSLKPNKGRKFFLTFPSFPHMFQTKERKEEGNNFSLVFFSNFCFPFLTIKEEN